MALWLDLGIQKSLFSSLEGLHHLADQIRMGRSAKGEGNEVYYIMLRSDRYIIVDCTIDYCSSKYSCKHRDL